MSSVRSFRSEAFVARPAPEVFAVYLDVERWPAWTSTVTDVRRLDAGALEVGARTRVRQPRLPVSEWVVTDVVPGESFTWQATGPGLVTVGRHIARPQAGGCVVTAVIEQRGPLAPVVALLTGRLTRRYLQIETDGIKRYCELATT
jgi:uncharacterized membrane protein